MTAAQLAKRIEAPRTTAHRILDTLIAEGYVLHDAVGHCYRISDQVRRLAFGFNRDSLVAEVARPILRDLCRDVLAPVGLAAPIGQKIVIQVSMDFEAPLALERLPEGTSFPVTVAPSGHLFLAHCSADVRREMIAAAPGVRSSDAPPDSALDAIRQRRFALTLSSKRAPGEGVIAVPVYFQDAYVASLHLRFMKRVLSASEAIERYLPKLQTAALAVESGIGRRIAQTPALFGGISGPLLAYDTEDSLHRAGRSA